MISEPAGWRAEDQEETGAQAGGRPVQAFWPLLRPAFRGVLLEPHRRTGSGRVAWRWLAAPRARAPGSAELAELRQRLGGALDEFAAELTWRDEGNDGAGPSDLHVAMAGLMRELIHATDNQLAAYAVQTHSGWMIRSWGFPRPAKAVKEGEAEETSAPITTNETVPSRPKKTRNRKRRLHWLPWLVGIGVIAGAGGWFYLRAPAADAAAQAETVAQVRIFKSQDEGAGTRPSGTRRPSGGGANTSLGGGVGTGGSGLKITKAAITPAEMNTGGSHTTQTMGSTLTLAHGANESAGTVTGSTTSGASPGAAGASAGAFAEEADSAGGAPDDGGAAKALVVAGPTGGLGEDKNVTAESGGLPINATNGSNHRGAGDLPGNDPAGGASTPSDGAPTSNKHAASSPAAAPPSSAAKRTTTTTQVPTVLTSPPGDSATPTSRAASAPVKSEGSALDDAQASKPESAEKPPIIAPLRALDIREAPLLAAPAILPAEGKVKATKLHVARHKPSSSTKPHGADAADLADEENNSPTSQTGGTEDKPSVTLQETIRANDEAGVSEAVASSTNRRETVVTYRIGKWRTHPVIDVMLPTWPTEQGSTQSLEAARARAWAKAQTAKPVAFRAPATRLGFSLRLEKSAQEAGPPLWRDGITGAPLAGGIIDGENAKVSWAGLIPDDALNARLLTADGRELARLMVSPEDRRVVIATNGEVTEPAPWLTVSLDERDGPSEKTTWRSPVTKGADVRWETRRTRNEISVVCHPDPTNKTEMMSSDVELVHAPSGWALTCTLSESSQEKRVGQSSQSPTTALR